MKMKKTKHKVEKEEKVKEEKRFKVLVKTRCNEREIPALE